MDKAGIVMQVMKRALLLLTLTLPCLAAAATLAGRVVQITDGDTINILDASKEQHRIRLAAIDAPERGAAYASVSTAHLGELVHKQQVTVEYDKLDRYGRVVGKVIFGGVDVNLRQVRAGLAWHYKAYADEQSPADQAAYAAAEIEARAVSRGLWSDRDPIPPWDYRRGVRP